jgi:hypothetical protein
MVFLNKIFPYFLFGLQLITLGRIFGNSIHVCLLLTSKVMNNNTIRQSVVYMHAWFIRATLENEKECIRYDL